MNIFEDIDKLKEKFNNPAYINDKQTIRTWEKEAKRAIITMDLAKNEAIKTIIKGLEKEIEEMDFVLQNDEKSTNEERSKIFFRKKLYQWFLDLFPQAEKTLAGIKNDVKRNL